MWAEKRGGTNTAALPGLLTSAGSEFKDSSLGFAKKCENVFKLKFLLFWALIFIILANRD